MRDTPPAVLPPRLRAALAEGPCFGRDRELDAIAAEIGKEGGAILIGGEPGIGKTRLAAEAASLGAGAGLVVLYGHSDEALHEPYQPLVEALSELVARDPQQAARAVGPAVGDLAPLLPALGRAPDDTAADLTRGGDRYQLFAGVEALLAGADARVLMVVDDLHWADPSTVLMLEYLLDAPKSSRAVFLVTYRTTDAAADEIVAARVARLERRADALRLTLGGLAEKDVERVVTGLRQTTRGAEDARLAKALVRETGGNPLFVTELVRSARESPTARGALADSDGLSPHVARLSEAPASPTATIRAIVRQRVARLGERAERTLACAAAIGTEFDVEVLTDALGADPGEIADDLDRAGHGALVTRLAPGRGGRVAFAHPLFPRTLYESLGPGTRGRLHRRIAEALESSAAEASATDLARHWAEATPRDDARAGAAAERAGTRTLEQRDPESAERWFAAALERVAPEDEARRCALLIELGRAQRDAGEASFRGTLLEAARSAERRGDGAQLVRAATLNNRGFVSTAGTVDEERIAVIRAALRTCGEQASAERAALLTTLAAELYFSPADIEECLAASDAAIEMARETCDAPVLASLLALRGITIWGPDRLQEWQAGTEEAERLADEVGDPSIQLPALHWRTAALVTVGDFAGASRGVDRQLELAGRLRQPSLLWLAVYDDANRAILNGRLEAAERLAGRALELGQASDQPDAPMFYAAQLSSIRFDQGRMAELQPLLAQLASDNPGVPSFRSALATACVEADLLDDARDVLAAEAADGFAGLPRDVAWIPGHANYAHVAADVGDRDAAAIVHERLAPFRGYMAYPGIGFMGSVDHALARLEGVLGRRQDAHEGLEAECERYERIGCPIWAARAALHLGRLRAEAGDPQAVELLDATARSARRLGSERVARQAAALRDRVQAEALMGGARGGAGPLSRRAKGGQAFAEHAELKCDGEVWGVSFAGRSSSVRDSLGLRYLVELLGSPGIERHVVELAAAHGSGEQSPASGGDGLSVRRGGGDAGPMLDDAAKRAFRERIEELREALEEAERFNDPERAAAAREELDAVAGALGSAVGLGGRDRRAASGAERARINVTRALRRAIARLSDADAELGAHLQAAISTGTFCAYRPSPRDEVAWTIR